MNSDKAIGLIDSGIGGFTVLKELQNYFPNENFIYLGDSANMPYGERTNEEIIKLVNEDIKFLEDRDVKFIVLACNTASSLADRLESNVRLFNIIEAGCLSVLDLKEENYIGLIATRATVHNRSYDNALKELTDEIEFISYGTPTLAQVINNQLDEINLLKKNIKLAIEPIIEQHPIKHLLLGCTHYPIVSKTIKEMYTNIDLINPAIMEAKLVEDYLIKNNLSNNSNESGKTEIFITGPEKKTNKRLLNELEINYNKLKYIQ